MNVLEPRRKKMLADRPEQIAKMDCIGAGSCLGGAHPGCEEGPEVLLAAGLAGVLARNGWDVSWTRLRPGEGASLDALGPLLRKLADAVAAAISVRRLPVVLGGDHSIAAGTWRGVGRALGHPPGLIWIDAHLDAHVPETSPSGNLHGMPLAALLGLGGSPVLADIPGPALDPASVVLIGARSYEPAEWEHVQRLGVKIVTAAEITERGLDAVIADAVAVVSTKGPWGISLDVDALDPSFAEAVSTPVPGGLGLEGLTEALHSALWIPGCCAFELTEFNPTLDRGGKTATALLELMDMLSSPRT